MFRLDSMIRTVCVTAFTSVSLSTFAPSFAHAADAPSSLPVGSVAVVNGVAVPKSGLDDAVRIVTARTGQPDTPQLRQILKSGLIAREVLRQNAEKAHYDQKPEVQQAPAAAKVGTAIQLYLKDSIHPEPVTDAQVKARYDQIAALLGKDEFKPRVITVGDEVTAKKVLDKMKSGQPFETLANEYSVAPSKTNGGEMPWLSFPVPVTEGRTQGLPMALAQTISTLPVGGTTAQPIQVGDVWMIVKLDAKRPTQLPTFDEAKEAMRKQLETLAIEKAAAQFTGNQIKSASIQQ